MGKALFAVIIFGIIIVPVKGIAQSKSHKGNVVTNQGDTIKGFITYRDSRTNPSVVFFSETDGMQGKKMTPADIKGFILENEQNPYLAYGGDISINPIDIDKLPYRGDRNFSKSILKKDSVFLRQLVRGKISLYEYEDFKFHYFLQYENDSIFELLNRYYMVSSPQEYKVNDKIYLQQIDSFLLSNKINLSSIQNTGYRKDDFIKLVINMNQTPDNSIQSSIYKPQTKKNRLGAGAGIAFLKFRYHNNKEPIPELKGTSTNPQIYLYYDYTGLVNLNRFFGRIELQWQKLNCIANEQRKQITIKHEQEITNIIITPSINYSLIKLQGIEIYGGAGIGVNFNLKNTGAPWFFSDTTYSGGQGFAYAYTEHHVLKSVWPDLNLHAGVIFSNRIDLNISYNFLSSPGEVNGESGSNLNIFSLRLNYLFSL